MAPPECFALVCSLRRVGGAATELWEKISPLTYSFVEEALDVARTDLQLFVATTGNLLMRAGVTREWAQPALAAVWPLKRGTAFYNDVLRCCKAAETPIIVTTAANASLCFEKKVNLRMLNRDKLLLFLLLFFWVPNYAASVPTSAPTAFQEAATAPWLIPTTPGPLPTTAKP